MNLSQPVTIQPPTITRSNGEVRVQKPITLSSLDIVIIDRARSKTCMARISPCPFPLVLWQGADYDAAGDYTQAQVEARVLDLLGPEPKVVLEGLYSRPETRN
jgi:hypothetical protein